MERLKKTPIGANKEVQNFLEEAGSTKLNTATTLADLIKRPELSYEDLDAIDKDRPSLSEDIVEQVNINIKYEGYIKRQINQVEKFNKLENKRIPEDFNYDNVPSLRVEARQKLEKHKPVSIGQASRISGVSPADISVLMIFLNQYKGNMKG